MGLEFFQVEFFRLQSDWIPKEQSARIHCTGFQALHWTGIGIREPTVRTNLTQFTPLLFTNSLFTEHKYIHLSNLFGKKHVHICPLQLLLLLLFSVVAILMRRTALYRASQSLPLTTSLAATLALDSLSQFCSVVTFCPFLENIFWLQPTKHCSHSCTQNFFIWVDAIICLLED